MFATDLTAVRAVAARHAPVASSRGLPRLGRLLRHTADRLDPRGARPEPRLLGTRAAGRPC